MTKKEFIWLAIRFLGIFKLVISLRFAFGAIGSFFAMVNLLPAADTLEKFIIVGLFSSFLKLAVQILLVIYLLFFGKIIFNIIHRTSAGSLDVVLEKQNFIEILIRFIGFWWLWRVVSEIFGLMFYGLWTTILSHPKWFLLKDSINQEFNEVFSNFLHSFQLSIVWSTPLIILLYAALAWYFLRHGKCFINLLNHLWLKATGQDATPNPVNPVNPV